MLAAEESLPVLAGCLPDCVRARQAGHLGQGGDVVGGAEERVGAGEHAEEDDAGSPHVHGRRLVLGLEEDLGRAEAGGPGAGGLLGAAGEAATAHPVEWEIIKKMNPLLKYGRTNNIKYFQIKIGLGATVALA